MIGLAGYLLYIISMMSLSFAVLGAAFPSLERYPLLMLLLGVRLPVMLKYMLWPTLVSKFRFTLPSTASQMIATLVGPASFLFYSVCMVLLSIIPSPSQEKYNVLGVPLGISLPFVLKKMLWPALISQFPCALPSNVSEMIAEVLGYLVYVTCMMGSSLLLAGISYSVWRQPLHSPTVKGVPYWIYVTNCRIMACMVMDNSRKHFSVSAVMAILLFLAGYLVYIVFMMMLASLVFNAIMVPVLPILLPGMLKYKNWVPRIIAGITLVVNDMHGLSLVQEPTFISEFLFSMPFSVSTLKATFPSYVIHMVCMVAMLHLVLIIAAGAIYKLCVWRPTRHFHTGLMLTIIIRLTLVLLIVIWRTMSKEPSSDTDMKATLLGLAGYLIYIGCSVELSYWMFVFVTEVVELVRTVGLVKIVRMILWPNTYY